MRATVLVSTVALTIGALLLLTDSALAQDANTVFLEELTSMEVRGAIQNGTTTIILPTAGTEQNGPHMVLGKHKYIVNHASEQIARRLGNAFVAPVVTYVPEGDVDPPSGHMRYAGTITLPNEFFMKLVEYAARSFKVHGFTDIVFLADSGGNLDGMRAVAEQLNREWASETIRVHFADDYYSNNGFNEWLVAQGETAESIGQHAGLDTTSGPTSWRPAMASFEAAFQVIRPALPWNTADKVSS
jgi:creatinine amidohydrolase